ncbi:cupin domain-containing protein [Neptuniibacter sp. SY11_33]|uniref:cupin domain-containing protein n=1 Tax=Neptuniibacter sp. SY11_33 TaxID=3398215 RepID=UPI0039F51975
MNLYDLSGSGPESEKFDPLFSTDQLRIERIISHAHATPAGEWYDQAWDEWVIVISGSAGLRTENPDKEFTLNAGDSYCFPAHQRHRVEWTDPDQPTIWLAVHYNEPKEAES